MIPFEADGKPLTLNDKNDIILLEKGENEMKHLVITKNTVKKIERKLLKVIQKEYANKEMYVAIRIDMSYQDDECLGHINIRYGKYEADGTVAFQYTTKIYLHSLNPTFIAGQFLQNVLRDEYECQGDRLSSQTENR